MFCRVRLLCIPGAFTWVSPVLDSSVRYVSFSQTGSRLLCLFCRNDFPSPVTQVWPCRNPNLWVRLCDVYNLHTVPRRFCKSLKTYVLVHDSSVRSVRNRTPYRAHLSHVQNTTFEISSFIPSSGESFEKWWKPWIKPEPVYAHTVYVYRSMVSGYFKAMVFCTVRGLVYLRHLSGY